MINKNNLIELVLKLEVQKSNRELMNPAFSNSTVGWQIEHSLLTINKIIETLKKSNPKEYNWKFSFPRILVFTMNRIPRGRAESPKVVQPAGNITLDSINSHLEITKQMISELDSLNENSYFEHPFFGKLKLKRTVKFLEIHTNHHLQIINDIVTSKL